MKFIQSRALKFVIGFAISGILVTLLITYVERNILSTYQKNLPYISLGDNVKNRSTKGHLWFEELMAGDPSLAFEKDVLPLFTSCLALLEGAAQHDETELGRFQDLGDETTDLLLKEAIVEIGKLTEAARQRYKFKTEAAANVQTDSLGNVIASSTGELAGGELDQKFDDSYESFQTTMDKLIEHTSLRVKEDSEFLNSLSWISIVLVVGFFTFLCMLIYRLQHGNDKMVAINQAKLEEEAGRMESISSFIEGVSSGNYSIQLSTLSETDGLGATLVKMRNKLNENAETDRRRNWATSGLAQIGDILRASNLSTTELYDSIIRFVVKYTDSNQGGLFILNNEDESNTYLELSACYAFERKKFLTKRVELGEGLVGQCFIEGEKIYLLDVPEDYIAITSGLGGANPSALLLMPMKVNERLYGVIELASFNNFDDYQIDLVEKLAESIASTISTVRTNESTRILLEKTQQQTEEMRAQEEEMRQNMEELEATQEEMRRKEKHVQDMLDQERMRNDAGKQGRSLITNLTKNHDIQTGNWQKALEAICSSVSKQISSSRVSVWLYDDKENKISCAKLYMSQTSSYADGVELFQKDFPAYFEAMLSEEIIVASEARSHAATRGFTEVYFKPLNIYSLLDVPFFNKGKIAGVICCEHEFEVKQWREEHVDFCKNCCDLVTIAYQTWRMNELERQVAGLT